MSDTPLDLEHSLKDMLREVVEEALRQQNETFQDRVDEICVLKDELSQIVKEAFILGADAQKSNETKVAHLLTQFEEAVTSTVEKMDKASQRAEERAEREGGYSEVAQKNLDRAGKFSVAMFLLSSIVFGWTVIHFSNVRRDVERELNTAKAELSQINAEIEAKKSARETEPARKSKR